MYIYKKYDGMVLELRYARTDKEREERLGEYDGWNYTYNCPRYVWGGAWDEKKIAKFRLRSWIRAVKKTDSTYIVIPRTPREERRDKRLWKREHGVIPFL